MVGHKSAKRAQNLKKGWAIVQNALKVFGNIWDGMEREDKILDCSNPQTVMSERELEVPFSNFLTSLEYENLMVDFSSIQKKQPVFLFPF